MITLITPKSYILIINEIYSLFSKFNYWLLLRRIKFDTLNVLIKFDTEKFNFVCTLFKYISHFLSILVKMIPSSVLFFCSTRFEFLITEFTFSQFCFIMFSNNMSVNIMLTIIANLVWTQFTKMSDDPPSIGFFILFRKSHPPIHSVFCFCLT